MKNKIYWAQETINHVFADKSLKGKFCLSPFTAVSVYTNGDVYLCHCSGWMSQPVGNLYKNTLVDILSNESSKSVRSSIVDGTYRYCDERKCGVIGSDQLITIDQMSSDLAQLVSTPERFRMPTEIWIAGDMTCNLSCPSCRTQVIKVPEDQYDQLIRLGKILQQSVFSMPTQDKITVHVSVSGEVFASPLLLNFLQTIDLDSYPNLDLAIQTNGLLMPRNWYKLGRLQGRVISITISVDASSARTYEHLRRGGKWEDIIAALLWTQRLKQQQALKFHLRMTCQNDNWSEIQGFYDLAKAHNVDVIEYSRISNWGTFTQAEFQHKDVFDPAHPDFILAQKQLDQVKNLPGVMLHGGLA